MKSFLDTLKFDDIFKIPTHQESLKKMIGSNKKILSLFPLDSTIVNALKDLDCSIYEIDLTDNFREESENTSFEKLLTTISNKVQKNSDSKFDCILISGILNFLPSPNKFIEKIHLYLKDDGFLIFSFENITFGRTRLEILNGNFSILHDPFRPRIFFDFPTILLLLKKSNLAIDEIYRIKGDLFENYDGEFGIFPRDLLESLNKDKESHISHYVIKTIFKEQDFQTFEEITSFFPNSVVTETLRNLINSYKDQILSLTKAIEQKDRRISLLEESMKSDHINHDNYKE